MPPRQFLSRTGLPAAARFVFRSTSAFQLVRDMLARTEPAIDRHRIHARLRGCVAGVRPPVKWLETSMGARMRLGGSRELVGSVPDR